MAAASTPVSSRFKASNAAQAMNQIMRLDFDSDKEAFLEVLEDYFYGDSGETLEDDLEETELSEHASVRSEGVCV